MAALDDVEVTDELDQYKKAPALSGVVIEPALQARSMDEAQFAQRNQALIDKAKSEGSVITDEAALGQYKEQRTAERKAAKVARAKAKEDGKDDPLWQRFKAWAGRTREGAKDAWNKGKDDPLTAEREDKTEEVTKFMGGMTRQELGMFIFQWGGLMMQNADQGFGGAAGAAGLGAMQGHQARGAAALEQEGAAADRALKERQVAASEYENVKGPGGEILERIRQPDGSFQWKPALDDNQKPIIQDMTSTSDEYKGEAWYLVNEAEKLGIPKEQVIQAKLGQKTRPEQLTWYREQLQTLVTNQKAKVKPEDKLVMEALGKETWTWVDPSGKTKTKPIHEMTPRDIGEYASYTLRQAEAAEADYSAASGALAESPYRD